MELLRKLTFPVFTKSGIESHQLLFPENSASLRLTITRVVVHPGAINSRHKHETAEQVWVALEGKGVLLLEGGRTESFEAGDVARFHDGDTHGFENTGQQPFTYLSITSPPLNFRSAYAAEQAAARQ